MGPAPARRHPLLRGSNEKRSGFRNSFGEPTSPWTPAPTATLRPTTSSRPTTWTASSAAAAAWRHIASRRSRRRRPRRLLPPRQWTRPRSRSARAGDRNGLPPRSRHALHQLRGLHRDDRRVDGSTVSLRPSPKGSPFDDVEPVSGTGVALAELNAWMREGRKRESTSSETE